MGQMMSRPLVVSSLLEHAARYHGAGEIVSRVVEDGIHRYTYAQAAVRIKRLARALQQHGIQAGDRVGTLAWNTYRHFELYYAVSGIGSVVHTINPRLFPEQIAWIINHADDQVVFFDLTFAKIVDEIADKCPGVKSWVAMTDLAHVPPMQNVQPANYEAFLAVEVRDFVWPELDENTAAALCYTSGTTGNPKGVLYSHRSTILQSFGIALPDTMNLSARDTVLAVVPMFHVNAWSLPYACAMVGAKLMLPGAALDGPSVYALFEQQKVTLAAGVPTVWLSVLHHMQSTNQKLSTVKRMVVGGSACPPSLMQAYADIGVKMIHAWGMTELSPLGTVASLKSCHAELNAEQRLQLELKQGRPPFGVDLKIVDEAQEELAWDGVTSGDLMVRGHWTIARYFGSDEQPLVNGWFPTGDRATIDVDGIMQITDRTKDVIKSGGEWISSLELESIAMSHPGIASAAVVGAKHVKWDERPILIAVCKPGASVSSDELLAYFDGKIAKWWKPDAAIFVDALPLGGTGKVQKNKLREEFGSVLSK